MSKKIIYINLLVLTSLLISGCVPILDLTTEVTLEKDEHWQVRIHFLLPGYLGPDSLLPFEEYIDESFSDLQAQGFESDWEKLPDDSQGNIPYQITATGVGYDHLSEFIGEGVDVTVDESSGQRRLMVSMAADPYQGMIGTNVTVILRAGKIISTNGNQTGNGAVVWNNPSGDMQAVVTEASGLSWSALILMGIGIVGIAVVVVIFSKKLRSRPVTEAFQYPSPQFAYPSAPTQIEQPGNHPSPVDPAAIPSESGLARFCGHCGAPLPPEAVFCSNCGKRRI